MNTDQKGGQWDQMTVQYSVLTEYLGYITLLLIGWWLHTEINSNWTTELKLKRSAGGNEARVYLLFNCENLGIWFSWLKQSWTLFEIINPGTFQQSAIISQHSPLSSILGPGSSTIRIEDSLVVVVVVVFSLWLFLNYFPSRLTLCTVVWTYW